MTLPDRYLLFVEYFNEAKFTAAQRALEPIWFKDVTDDKPFYGALIQLSVAFFHLHDEKNPKAARKTFERARNELARFGDRRLGVEVGELIRAADALFERLGDAEDVSDEILSHLPRIQLSH